MKKLFFYHYEVVVSTIFVIVSTIFVVVSTIFGSSLFATSDIKVKSTVPICT